MSLYALRCFTSKFGLGDLGRLRHQAFPMYYITHAESDFTSGIFMDLVVLYLILSYRERINMEGENLIPKYLN